MFEQEVADGDFGVVGGGLLHGGVKKTCIAVAAAPPGEFVVHEISEDPWIVDVICADFRYAPFAPCLEVWMIDIWKSCAWLAFVWCDVEFRAEGRHGRADGQEMLP